MNESENIQKHEYEFSVQNSDSTDMLFADTINRLVCHINDLKQRLSNYERENAKLQSVVHTLTKQNEHLIQEIKDANTSLELEKIRNQQRNRNNTLDPKEFSLFEGQSTPRVLNRRQPPKAINTDTIARLKNDRRHYAMVCDAALSYWKNLLNMGLVDTSLHLTPKCGITVAARIVCCFQVVVDPNIRWSSFEKHWGVKHLQSNLHRSTYRDEKKYALVNSAFGRPDNTPFIPKSQFADN